MNETLIKTFGERMTTRLNELDISMAELARRTDRHFRTIYMYSNGTGMPNLSTAYNIAIALGVSLDWLCGLESDEEDYKRKIEAMKGKITDMVKRLEADIQEEISK